MLKTVAPFLVNNLWKGKSLLPHDGEEPPPMEEYPVDDDIPESDA